MTNCAAKDQLIWSYTNCNSGGGGLYQGSAGQGLNEPNIPNKHLHPHTNACKQHIKIVLCSD